MISPIAPVLTVTNTPQNYTGSPIAAVVSGTGGGAVSNVKYGGSTTVPTNAGTYAITADIAASANYTAATNATAGNFVINPISLVITANNQSKCFNQAFTFVGTEFTSSGLISPDAVTSVTLTSAGTDASASVNGSPYSIVPSSAIGTGLDNYTISYKNGTLTVNPLPTPTIAGDTSPCNKTTGVIYSTQSSMSEYAWTITGGNITSGQGTNSITISWNTDGNQSLGVSYKNSNGCSGSLISTITVHPLPVIGSFN